MIVEIFAGTAKVTAELRKIGMSSAFGTDHIRHKQAAAQVVVADLSTEEGVSLLMQWLADEHVVGLFIAPLRFGLKSAVDSAQKEIAW